MKFIINLIAKYTGASKLWKVIDGYKTKTGGVLAILFGLIGIIEKLQKVLEQHDFQALFEFIKTLPADQSVLMLLGGLTAIGIAHKFDKATK